MKYVNILYVVALVAIASLAVGCSNDMAFSSNSGLVGKSATETNIGTGGGTTTTPPGTVPVNNVNTDTDSDTVAAAYPCGDADVDKDDVDEKGDLDTDVTKDYDVTPGTKKVLVCHIPKGNPGNAHDICVSAKSFPARASKCGDTDEDYFGPCKPPVAPPVTPPTNVSVVK